MPLTTEEEFSLKQMLSGDYLTEHIPDDWESMSETEQTAFVSTRIPTIFSAMSAEDIRIIIGIIHVSSMRYFNEYLATQEPES